MFFVFRSLRENMFDLVSFLIEVMIVVRGYNYKLWSLLILERKLILEFFM